MANDLIGFGNDITKVRAQIPENLEVIYSPVFQKELTERLSTILSDAEITPEGFSNMAPVFQQLGIPLSLSNMVNILMAGFVIGLRHIIENPARRCLVRTGHRQGQLFRKVMTEWHVVITRVWRQLQKSF